MCWGKSCADAELNPAGFSQKSLEGVIPFFGDLQDQGHLWLVLFTFYHCFRLGNEFRPTQINPEAGEPFPADHIPVLCPSFSLLYAGAQSQGTPPAPPEHFLLYWNASLAMTPSPMSNTPSSLTPFARQSFFHLSFPTPSLQWSQQGPWLKPAPLLPKQSFPFKACLFLKATWEGFHFSYKLLPHPEIHHKKWKESCRASAQLSLGESQCCRGQEPQARLCPSWWMQCSALSAASPPAFEPKITTSAIFNDLIPLISLSHLTFFGCKTLWGHSSSQTWLSELGLQLCPHAKPCWNLCQTFITSAENFMSGLPWGFIYSFDLD